MVFHRFFHQLWYFIGFFPQNIVFHRFFHRYFIRFSPKHMVFHRFSMVLIHPYAINFTDEAMQIKVFYSPDASVELSDTTLRELWSRGLQCWRQLGVEMMDRRIIWFGDCKATLIPELHFYPPDFDPKIPRKSAGKSALLDVQPSDTVKAVYDQYGSIWSQEKGCPKTEGQKSNII